MGWKDIFSKRRNEGRVAPVQRAPRDAAEILAERAAISFDVMRRQAPAWLSLNRSFIAGYMVGYTAEATGGTDHDDAENAVGRLLSPLTGEMLPPANSAALLLGHHEAKCGTERLLALALACAAGRAMPEDVITACDTAADRLQTHDPQRNFRFTVEERKLLLDALKNGAVLNTGVC